MKVTFYYNQIAGFTLVELLVVLGLFSSIATLSLGSLFNTQAINGRLQETQAILDNINLSSQTITRDIRFGSEFYCARSIPGEGESIPSTRRNCNFADASPGKVLIFTPADATNELDRVMYYVSNGILYKDTYPYSGGTTTEQMTTSDVNINSLIFYVEGAQTSDGSNDYLDASDFKQPLITMFLSGVTKPTKSSATPVPFNFQTVVSASGIDNR